MKEEDILADIEQEGMSLEEALEAPKDALDALLEEPDEQVESPAESPAEKEQTDKDPSQEGEVEAKDESHNTPGEESVPFHKHPRWQKLQEENARLKTEFETLTASVNTLTTNQATAVKPMEDLPSEWVALYGDDDAARNAYNLQIKQMADMETRIREGVEKAQISKAAQKDEEVAQWNTWVDSELQSLVDSGEQFDKNKLMKVALDMQPTDDQGNISFSKALQIYKLQEKQVQPKATVNKEVAAKTDSNNKGSEVKTVAPTSNNLRSRSFSSLVQE